MQVSSVTRTSSPRASFHLFCTTVTLSDRYGPLKDANTMGSPQNAFERMMQAAAAAKKQDPSTPVKTPSKRSASKQAQQTPKRLRPAGGIAAAAATAEAAALQPQHDRQASDHLNVISNQGHVGNVNIPTVPNNVEGPAAAAAISADVWLTTAELPAGGSSATVDLTPIPAHQQEHEQVQQQEDETAPSSSIEPHQPAAAAGMLPQQQIAAPSTGSTEQHAAAVAAFKSVFQSQKHARQKYDYLLVYDLEATCNRARCAKHSTNTALIGTLWQLQVLHALGC